MQKLNIKPINIGEPKNISGILKTITEVIEFQKTIVNWTNTFIDEMNKSLPTIEKDRAEKYDHIKKLIESKASEKYDDNYLIESISKLENAITEISNELSMVKSATSSNQKEIRSNRKESGYKIDVVEQKLNRITEI